MNLKRITLDDTVEETVNKINENSTDIEENVSRLEDIEENVSRLEADFISYKDNITLKTSKIEKELNDYKATMQQINIHQSPTQKASGHGIVSLPPNAAEGQISVVAKGNTYTNFVKNGNFANGTSSWESVGSGTLSANNNTLVHTGNGTNAVCVARNIGSLKWEQASKIFIRATARVTNANASQIVLRVDRETGSATVAAQINSPVQNRWYTLYGIVTRTDQSGTAMARINHTYADAATANGKVMEVREVFAINLDQYPELANLTVDQINARIPHWFDGTKSTISAMRIKSVGKNIWGGRKAAEDIVRIINNPQAAYLTTVDGRNVLALVGHSALFDKLLFSKFKPNTQYVIKVEGRRADDTETGGLLRINYTDGTTMYLVNHTSSWAKMMITTAQGKTVQGLYSIYGSPQKIYYFDYDTLQIEEGTTETPYEPYKETVAYLPNVVLRSLPNGVKDEINVSEGKLIQRIGLDYSDVDNPTFTRNSVAYLSDGTQVAANQPRFEDGPFAGKKAIMIEERTTNLFPADKRLAFTSAWTSATLNGTYTVSIHGGTGKLVLSGGATGEVVAGQSLTFSVSDATVTFTPVDGTPERCQLEQKGYATSFVDGTRATETLTIPTEGVLNPQEGTVEFWYYPLETTKYQLLWYVNPVSSNGFYMTLSGGKITFVVGDGTIGRDIASPTPVIAKTWYYVNAVWRQTGIALYINGSKVGELSFIPAPIFSSNFTISHSSDTFAANMLIDDLRISSIARSDEEILATYQSGQPLPVDEYTAYKLKFDDNLNKERATPLIYQLAEPVKIPVQVSGTLVGYPSGTVYIEPYVADAGIYTDKMEVLYSDLPIKALEKISKVDFDTGLETELDITAAVIAEDKLSFTHPDLTSGDIVFFVYEHGAEGTIPETEVEFYDSRYVVKDDVTGKFYKWNVKVSNGTPTIEVVEV